MVFYPGNQRLSIIQTGRGLDDHNHLTVDTVLSGSVPILPPGAEVTMDPFKETYQYYPAGKLCIKSADLWHQFSLVASVLLFIYTLAAFSCHLHLCERVYSGFSGARLRVLLFPAEAEHHL